MRFFGRARAAATAITLILGAVHTPAVHAQPAPAAPPAAPPPAAAAAAPEQDAPATEPPPLLDTGPAPLPPPAPARPGDQSPHPYRLPPDTPGERKLDLGPDFVFWHRLADGDSVSYSPDVAVGAHVRIELREWLALRLYFLRGQHGVSIDTGGLGLPGEDVQQPDISVTQLGARLEPTWVVTSRLRLWAGLGAAWARAQAPRPRLGDTGAQATERAGVFLELGGGLGASFDVVPRWLAVWTSASIGAVVDETGDLFQRQQAIASDRILAIDGLPEMSAALSGALGVALIL